MIELAIWMFVIYGACQLIGLLVRLSSLEKVHSQLREHLDKIIHNVNIEKVNNVEYWYDADNQEFLGQGTTVDEVISNLKIRFPEHIFVIKDQGILCSPEWKISEKLDLDLRRKYYENK
jgi:hypothetical protein